MFLSLLFLLFVPGSGSATRVTIMEVQGRDHRSPLAGERVLVEGIVTSITPGGFFLQDPRGDGDPSTSDAVFVATDDRSERTGDQVDVAGWVVERSADSNPHSLPRTEIDAAPLVILARDRALPADAVIGAGQRVPPTAIIDDDALQEYQPLTDGIDFYESLEGMRVTIRGARVTGALDAFGDAWVVPAGLASGLNARGGLTARPLDANPERIRVRGAGPAAGSTAIPIGARLGDVGGIVDGGSGGFELIPSAIVATGAPAAPETSALSGDDAHLLVAAFNVRNFAPGDANRTRRLAQTIASNLGAPDILALAEIQDNSGTLDDGTVAADISYRLLIDAVAGAGGPRYEAREVAPADGEDGGEPGGNIRVAFLFRPDRVTFVERSDDAAGGAPFETHFVAGHDGVHLTRSPGRIDPGHPAWSDSRKPLAGEFVFGGRRLFVVAVHFRSQSGSTPDFGAVQPPTHAGAAERAAQARVVRAFVDELRRLDPGAPMVVLGDFNDDWFSQPLAILEEDRALVNLWRTLPAVERYSYVYAGNSHAYDHILVRPAESNPAAFDVVHVNAEYADNTSDHDPVAARLSLSPPVAAAPAGAIVAARPNPSSGDVVIGPARAAAEVVIYDVRGAQVRRFELAAGAIAVWDGNDARGKRVASGVYFLSARGSFGQTTRTLVRVH
jgi:uncharacterized protein